MTVTLLTNHGEITALRAGGLSFPRLSRAFVAMGLCGAVASFVLGEYAAPPAVRRARELFAEIGLTQPVMQEQYNVFFRDEPSRRIFYIGHMNPASNQLERITIWQQDEAGRVRGITAADWAEARGEVWYLRQGATVSLDPDGQQTGPPARFGEQEVTLWRALQNYYASKRTPVEMSAAELGDLVATVGGSGRDTHREQVQWHFKYSLPLAGLVFALCAAPIAFRCARYGSFVGVVVAVGIVFLYNGVRSWTLAFGLAGSLDPFLAGWIPDLVFGTLGVALLIATR
jgi:lipopolysaccharide export system permease protein